jgi:hypothetical protein
MSQKNALRALIRSARDRWLASRGLRKTLKREGGEGRLRDEIAKNRIQSRSAKS